MVDAVGLEGMKGQIRIYLQNIDLNDVSRKSHDRILYEMANQFRSLRGINHKKVLVN